MKKLIVLALLMVMAAGAHATQANPPQSPNGGPFDNLLFIGAPVYRVEVSTPTDTPILLLAGAGILYGTHCSSGTTSGYGVAFDSATTSGITYTTAGKALDIPVFSTGLTESATLTGVLDEGSSPVQFTNGLVFLTHGVAVNCYIKARAIGGANPGP